MKISDEAVEAALVAFSDRAMLVGSSHRDNLHAALTAAAPFIAAQAWDEGAMAVMISNDIGRIEAGNPYRSVAL